MLGYIRDGAQPEVRPETSLIAISFDRLYEKMQALMRFHVARSTLYIKNSE